jgi:hypothetical protein
MFYGLWNSTMMGRNIAGTAHGDSAAAANAVQHVIADDATGCTRIDRIGIRRPCRNERKH